MRLFKCDIFFYILAIHYLCSTNTPKLMKKEVTNYQGNALTEGRYDFNRIEKNCLYKIIEKVQHDYIENQSNEDRGEFKNLHITLPPAVLEDITDKWSKKEAHDALIKLRKRDVEIRQKDGSWFNCGFINWCEWDAKENVYKVEVSYRIMPYLVELAKQYTSYSLTVAMTLRSAYSQRLYELCCQYRNNFEKDGFAGFHKTQQQLREMFCLEEKYTRSNDFNSNIIYRPQAELKKLYDKGQCDLYFEVQIKGRCKKMAYDFKIYTRQQSERQKKTFDDLRKKWAYIHGRMSNTYKRDPKFVERVMKALDFNPSLIDPVLTKLQRDEKKFQGAEFARYFRAVLFAEWELK